MKWGNNVKALPWALAFALLIGISACSSPGIPSPSPISSPVATDKVAVINSCFDPPNILVTAGTTVTWTNRDKTSYFIADEYQEFNFNLPAEGTFSVTFNRTGTHSYFCAEYPSMQGTITVALGVHVNFPGNGKAPKSELPGPLIDSIYPIKGD